MCINVKTVKKIKNFGDDVYLVESAFREMFLPTCSKECASIVKEREVQEIKTIFDRLENTEIKKERW